MGPFSGKKRVFMVLLMAILVSCGKGEPIIGKDAPPFRLDLIDGGQIGITELRGKPVILYFFASW